ncbi:hypothetical protein FRACA_170044 [Frankia canadensis]|uniref:Uncharacterized protein n=1 Tax=Frankia canadensis TaxID=1836972 RepID=A0A2I2KN39_9ACTN|nr:hypothetical protein [Frankia canadensis]SNQ47084.1 hypothetical protein FRACA_170044 [Frankia canadensis]SOU54374.1 hypothetical protein FRACA_170044 [Frankia canadensis]
MELSELMSLGKALEELEAPKARERRREHGGTAPGRAAQHSASGDAECAEDTHRGKVSSIVARELGLTPTTYERLRSVYRAAEDPAENGSAEGADDRNMVTMTITRSDGRDDLR